MSNYLEHLKELLSPAFEDYGKGLSNPLNSSPNYQYEDWHTYKPQGFWENANDGAAFPGATGIARQAAGEEFARKHMDQARAEHIRMQYAAPGDVHGYGELPELGGHLPPKPIPHTPVESVYSPKKHNLGEIAGPEREKAAHEQRVKQSDYEDAYAKFGPYAHLYLIARDLKRGLPGADVSIERQ